MGELDRLRLYRTLRSLRCLESGFRGFIVVAAPANAIDERD